MTRFQSTLPHGERLCGHCWGAHQGSTFQSTLPHGERPTGLRISDVLELFQSTLPHGERQEVKSDIEYLLSISIHAPAWGATRSRNHGIGVSIYFNPRSRIGSDVEAVAKQGFDLPISIHAPAWGATCRYSEVFWRNFHFNPRSRMGSDIWRYNMGKFGKISIHAPAWGATSVPIVKGLAPKISIHAPAWGATYCGRPRNS